MSSLCRPTWARPERDPRQRKHLSAAALIVSPDIAAMCDVRGDNPGHRTWRRCPGRQSAQQQIDAFVAADHVQGDDRRFEGVVIDNVDKGSAAAQVGLHKDDIIIGLNRERIPPLVPSFI
jgi:S1-C subfamily serine protease